MKVFTLLKRNWQIVLLLVLGVSICWPLFVRGYFPHHDDLQVIRIFEMRRCLADFQIPCRWVPDMGYGNGFPLFNFYGVLPYYLGALVSFVAGYIASAKFLFLVSLLGGGLGIYFLVKKLFGVNPALVAGSLYLLAPYRALDAYVRGAVAELFAMSLVPFVLLFFYKFIKERSKSSFVLATLFLAAFLITHNIMTILFTPVLAIFMIFWLWQEKFNNLKGVIVATVVGFGLAAFFILPAFLEKSLVQTEALTRFELDFRAHFVSVKQLFWDRTWGYGASILGTGDTISFQIGWPLWWTVLAATAVLFLKKVKREHKLLALILLGLFTFSIFMTHNKSAFIWERISILKFFQFPWRFLSLTIFSASLLAGFAVSALGERWKLTVSVLIIVLAFVLNWEYFAPRDFYYGLSDSQKLTGAAWEEQQKGAILDYLPRTASEPKEKAPVAPFVVSGMASVKDFINKSNGFSFKAEVARTSQIELPVFYFPGWKVQVDGKEEAVYHQNLLGRIAVNLERGSHTVAGKFTNTPIRAVANAVSLVSALLFLTALVYGKSKKIFR